MNPLPPFQLGATKLRRGVTLIEASAGTGKTFTIAGLILRLVLEESIPIGEILAVTYTVAATAELRDRVRKRLRSALEDLRRGESDDEIVRNFLRGDSVERGIRDLDAAVLNFDEARIFTIHGFCQRVLRENAFESGVLFDMELLADSSAIFDEVARDFWRQRFYTAHPLLPRLAVAKKVSYEVWKDLLNKLRNHPDIRILPEADGQDCPALGELLVDKFGDVLAEWKRNGKAVAVILAEDKNLTRNKETFRKAAVEEIVRSFDALLANFQTCPPDSLLAIQQCSTSRIAKGTKPDKQPPRHRLFELCEDFAVLTRRFFDRLTHEFVTFAKEQTSLRKTHRNVVTYDDLLTRVRDALAGAEGKSFAKILGGKYRAALIDEFQDTDPVQYEIFHGIFGHGDHHLYFIGDPKQAIYGFRGADVFTYLHAAREASEQFTLNTNWRSENRLLDAINLLFEKHPSLGNGIDYRMVSPPEKPRPGFKELTGDDRESRLRFRFLESDHPEGKAIGAGEAETLISQAVVADIARLKAGGAGLGGERLKFGDMAVLVRSNAQAANMQKLLRDRGIKSVLKTGESVFHTEEAAEMLALLEALLEPGTGYFLNTALATSLFGKEPLEIVGLEEEESKKLPVMSQFLDYRELWKDSCFMAVFRKLLVEQNVRERLVRLPGGERKLTNFLHLAELLHRAETARQLTPEALRLWLGKQIHSEETVDEHLLRLESDEDGVLIATIHKCKGLEYPVVFCPFLWKQADNAMRSEVLFHDPKADHCLTLDLGEGDDVAEHDRLTGEERTGESMRMLYVALTRAQNLCHVYAGDISKFELSPLARILDGAPGPSFKMLAEKSGGTIDVTPIDPAADEAVKVSIDEEQPAQELQSRSFHGAISQTRMIASFSGLISDGAKEEETDHDTTAAVVKDAVEDADSGLLADFERGVRAGLFWHDLLEHLDFQTPGRIDSLVTAKLATHGMAGAHFETVSAQVRKLIKAPLQPGLALDQISLQQRISEVEFSHPLAALSPDRMRAAFARHGSAAGHLDFSASLGRLNFRPVEGFMRGFIDLLFEFDGRFYLVDWKSNWLGARPGDYAEASLRPTMLGSFYFLQYHLYAVAADLFLSGRRPGFDYQRDFGGVFYIFLRGIDPAIPGNGIFHDRPDAALIRDLRETLTGRRS